MRNRPFSPFFLPLACILLVTSVSLTFCFRTMFADTASIGKASSTFKSPERSTERSMEQLVKKPANLKV